MNSKLWFLVRTAEERRERYKLLRSAGFPSSVCYRVRDWRPNKIKIYIELNTQKLKGGEQ